MTADRWWWHTKPVAISQKEPQDNHTNTVSRKHWENCGHVLFSRTDTFWTTTRAINYHPHAVNTGELTFTCFQSSLIAFKMATVVVNTHTPFATLQTLFWCHLWNGLCRRKWWEREWHTGVYHYAQIRRFRFKSMWKITKIKVSKDMWCMYLQTEVAKRDSFLCM